jgi:predicted acyltransferase
MTNGVLWSLVLSLLINGNNEIQIKVFQIQLQQTRWKSASQAFLGINMAEYRKCATTFNGSVLYQISTKCMKWLMEIAIFKLNFFMNQYGGKF